jgi:hypothetical protein
MRSSGIWRRMPLGRKHRFTWLPVDITIYE